MRAFEKYKPRRLIFGGPGDLTEGFLRNEFGVVIFGGAYTWRGFFSEFTVFLFRSYSFGIEMINTCIRSRSSLENLTRFQTKMGKVYNRFQTKRPKNPTLWGSTYLYGLYKRPPPPPCPRVVDKAQVKGKSFFE